MATCIDDTIQWDVKDSQCAVQRNHNLNSKTGNLIETSAKGEISRPESTKTTMTQMEAADN